MPTRRVFRVQKSRTPLIATTFVLLGGVSTCIAIALPFSDRLTIPLVVIGVVFPLLALVLSRLRLSTREVGAELLALAWSKPPKTVRYQLKKVPPLKQEKPRPPTAASIRELKGR